MQKINFVTIALLYSLLIKNPAFGTKQQEFIIHLFVKYSLYTRQWLR